MELRAVKSFYTARDGLVELEDDVLSIVTQVREQYGNRIKICLEPTTGEYVFSENCEDGTERLIFTTQELDGRALERLVKSDSHSRGYEDTYDAVEREQDEVQAAKEESFRERMRDGLERVAHALKKDGFAESPWPTQVQVKRDPDG